MKADNPQEHGDTSTNGDTPTVRDVRSMSFEELVAELEVTAQAMDSGAIGIEEATTLYGRAAELHRAATQRLSDITSRIQALREAADSSS